MSGSRPTIAMLSAAVALSVAAGWLVAPVALADEADPVAGEEATAAPTETATEAPTETATEAATETASEAATAAPTEAATVAPTEDPAVVPGAPQTLAAAAQDRSLHVTWTAPASDGGSAVESYDVVATPHNDSFAAPPVVTVTEGSASTVLRSLVNGATYDVSVTATNAAGESRPAKIAATPRTVPGAPAVRSVTAGNRSAEVRWAAPESNGGAAISRYAITTTSTGSTLWVDHDVRSATISGLPNGSATAFTVSAKNVAGYGAADRSSSVTPHTVPGAPDVRSASAGDHVAEVHWDPPAGDGGATISAYVVEASPSGNTVRVDGSRTGARVPGLPNGSGTTLTVTAVNTAGRGQASRPSGTVVPRARAHFTLLRQPAPRVVYGQASVLRTALLRSDGQPARSQRVHLLAKTGPNSGWRRVASGLTGARGMVTLRPTLRASSALRLHHPASAVAASDVAPRSVAVAKRITATPNRSSTRVGMRLVIRGRVAPAQSVGSPVRLLRRVSGSYVHVATGRMVTHRRYVVRWKPRAVGDYTLRVRKAGDAARAAGLSPLIRHRVNPESAADIARDILRDNGTTLATVHLSSGADGATPQQNLVDVANGRLAHTSCYGSGGCGTTTLDRRMLRAVRAMGQRATLTVSEFAGGSHASGSTHYRGKGVDITWVYGRHVGWGSNYFMVVNLCRAYGANEIFSPSNDPWGGHHNHVHCGWP